MFIIKSGRGANKVLIDSKPPADRLNLTEVEVTIQYSDSIVGEKLLEENENWWFRKWDYIFIYREIEVEKGVV